MPQFRPLSETKFINDANLVSYWKLEDVSDSKGANTLTNNGTVVFDAAKFSNGANLGTSNSTKSLLISTNASLEITGNITISAWIKASSAPTFSTICGKFLDSTHKGYWLTFNGGKCGMYISTTGSNQTGEALSSTLSNDVWYYVTGTYDGSNIKIYINGKLENSIAQTGSIYSSTGDLAIGKLGSLSADYFSGSIDDTAIFSRALSASEVNELYQGMTLGEYLPNANTKLLLHLNGNSTDSSGNNNNGTDTAITYSQANGKFGMGAGFNGSTSRIVFSSTGVPKDNAARTVGCWFNPVALPTTSSGRGLVGIGTDGTLNLFNLALNNDAGTQQVGVLLYTQDLLANITLSTGTWYNLIATFDGTTLKAYLNGKEIASGARTLNTSSTAINLGSRAGAAGTFFSGAIDEVPIESVAWTPQQVAKYYSQSRGFYATL